MSDVENSPDKTGDRRTVETEQVRERRDSPSDDSSAFAAFDLFKVYLDKKLDNFKRDLTDESEVKSDQIVKKLKAENSYKASVTIFADFGPEFNPPFRWRSKHQTKNHCAYH